jgi:hypothetical protein
MSDLTDLDCYAVHLHNEDPEKYRICGVFDPNNPKRKIISVSFYDRGILNNTFYTCQSSLRMPKLCEALHIRPGSRATPILFNACWKKLQIQGKVFELTEVDSESDSDSDESAGEDSDSEEVISVKKKSEPIYFYDRKASDPAIKGLIINFGDYSERRLVIKNERSSKVQVRGRTEKSFSFSEIQALAYRLAKEEGVKRLSCKVGKDYFNYIFDVLGKRGLIEYVSGC